MSPTMEKVRAIIAKQLEIDIDKIQEKTDIAEDLGADSLDVVELMMMVEEEFEITIDEEAAKSFVTVADVAGYIEENS